MENKAILSTAIQSFGGNEDGLSVQGASHIKNGKICQDFGGHYRCDDYALAVVCDGHGGDVYIRSDRGSKFGVQVAIDSIRGFMNNKQDFLSNLFLSDNKDVQKKYSSKVIDQLIKSIILSWNNLVSEDLQQNPITEDELKVLSDKYKTRYTSEDENQKFSAYGSTLIAVVYAPEFWFGIRIGDGRCVSISKDGTICDPIPWNDKCFLNQTTSLCEDKAFENFRHCFYTDNFPLAIYVGTDGIDDSWGGDEHLFTFYINLTQTFAQSGFEGGKQELRDFLPKLTLQGSGDDVSISGIVDMEAIKEIFKESANAEKQQNAEQGEQIEEKQPTKAVNNDDVENILQ